jgi:hypothetical protein
MHKQSVKFALRENFLPRSAVSPAENVVQGVIQHHQDPKIACCVQQGILRIKMHKQSVKFALRGNFPPRTAVSPAQNVVREVIQPLLDQRTVIYVHQDFFRTNQDKLNVKSVLPDTIGEFHDQANIMDSDEGPAKAPHALQGGLVFGLWPESSIFGSCLLALTYLGPMLLSSPTSSLPCPLFSIPLSPFPLSPSYISPLSFPPLYQPPPPLFISPFLLFLSFHPSPLFFPFNILPSPLSPFSPSIALLSSFLFLLFLNLLFGHWPRRG